MSSKPRGAVSELFGLLKPFWPLVTLSIALGMIGGLSVTALLATINTALHSQSGLTQNVVLLFAGLCLLALTSSIFSDIGTNYVGQHIIQQIDFWVIIMIILKIGRIAIEVIIESAADFRLHQLQVRHSMIWQQIS